MGESLEESSTNPKVKEYSIASYHTMDKVRRPNSPGDLNPNDHYFKPNKEFTRDILAIAKDGMVEYFIIFKWAFHGIKDLNLNNKALTSKLEVLEAKVASQNVDEVLWTVEEKMAMVDFYQRVVDNIKTLKKDNDNKSKYLEK